MIKAAMDWLGFGAQGHSTVGHGHSHGPGNNEGGHGHTHGVMDPTIATTERGIWAIKWSFIGLAITAVLQMFVVGLSGSVALLADTIHNVGDAATAIPLYVAFWFARRKPNARFTYGYGRVEDLAGVIVVALILFSALVAGYQAIDRLINPQDIAYLGAVAAAGIVGFLGNEVVAVFRIRVGREIQSAALIADGYHARVDGLTSLAVVLGAIGVWLGLPLADPVVGLIITLMIFGIVWQSAKAVFSRMLDGVEPEVIDELRHAAEHVPGVRGLDNVRARWVGHRLHAEADLLIDAALPVREGMAIAARVREAAMGHLPALGALSLALADGATAGHGHQADDHGDDEGHGHSHGGEHHSHDFFI
jgi:cation diffusion facilitator family transporter